MESKHTPTPWNATNDQHGGVILVRGARRHRRIDAIRQFICEVPYWDEKGPRQKGWLTQEEAKANATFIVRAVNMHEELLEVAKNAEVYEDALRIILNSDGDKEDMRAMAEAALEKSKGNPHFGGQTIAKAEVKDSNG